MRSYAAFKKRMLKDKETKAAYDALQPEFDFITRLIDERLKKGYTQAQLAKKIGTKQSAVARLESGSYNPSLALLRKVAKALDREIVITFS